MTKHTTNTTNKPIITVRDVSVAYKNDAVLWEVNGDVPEGSLVAIIGPNGAGKSTLIKTIMGIIKPKSGKIKIMGQELKDLKKVHEKISYMPQRDSIDDNFPVNCLDVVLMGRYGHMGWFKRPSKEDRQLAMDALRKFDMDDFAHRQIGALSGGQKQRVLLARSYVQDAYIWVLDEPFGGIDAKTEELILQLLKELRDEGKTIIVVTHDLTSLRQHFDYVWLLNIHTVDFGRPDEVMTGGNIAHCYGGTIHAMTPDHPMEVQDK